LTEPKKKVFKIFSVILIVILSFSLGYVVAEAGFSAPNIYLDDLPSSATYTIKTDGIYYWAVRYDGKICFTSTNCSYVICSTADSIPTGGRIVIKASSTPYYLTSGVYTESKAVLFEGESLSYKEGYGISAYFVATTDVGFMFTLEGQWSSISKLTIDGNNTGSDGVLLGDIDQYIESSFIHHCNTYAIQLSGTNHWIKDNWIEWNTIGINLNARSYITNNHFVGNGQDMSITTAYGTMISGNTFHDSTTRAINIWGTPTNNLIISGNIFDQTLSAPSSINEFIIVSTGKTLYNSIISGNNVDGYGYAAHFISVGNDAVLDNVTAAFNTCWGLTGTGLSLGTGITGAINATYGNIGFP
jgi:hypothetical protein